MLIVTVVPPRVVGNGIVPLTGGPRERLIPYNVASDPGATRGCDVALFTSPPKLKLGTVEDVTAGSTRNPPGIVTTCNPEVTLTMPAAGTARGEIEATTSKRVGLSTQTLRATTSGVPKPTSVWPSTKFVFVP